MPQPDGSGDGSPESLSDEDVIAWPRPHPMIELMLRDYPGPEPGPDGVAVGHHDQPS